MEEILLKYLLGELEETEQKNLLRQIADNEELREAYIRMQNMYALSFLTTDFSQEMEGKKGYHDFTQRLHTKKQKKLICSIIQYAAIFLLITTSTFFVTRALFTQANDEQELNTLYVPAGQRAQLTLHDGTQVWLNSQSTLIYPSKFSKNKREVSLEGEAYFNVAEDRKKPFVVSTQQLTMEVLGTEFNVDSYKKNGYTRIALVNGSIKVRETSKKGQSILLSPNQQITFSNNLMRHEKLSDPEHLLWRDGIYAFNNARLIQIIEKLELYYDTQIEIEDPEIFNTRYTGKFRQRDGIDEILHILQKTQSFNILKDREKNIITLSK
jgi:transmembrane sensor